MRVHCIGEDRPSHTMLVFVQMPWVRNEAWEVIAA